VKNEHKDNLRRQILAFVVKQFKEFEAIKWDWNPLWHIFTNDKCLLATYRHELPWSHFVENAKFISNNLL
jgi:hypothetical protein